jgi:superfamily II DNA or RNA helicase
LSANRVEEIFRLGAENTMELRDYQKDALQAVVDNLCAGVRQQLLVLATGLGKTVIAAQLPVVLKDLQPGKLLFVAHRNELLTQAMEKISLWNPTLKVGLEKAESHADLDCDVIIACNASIGRAGSTRMDHFWDGIGTIVIDEAHHSIGSSYLNILEASGVLKEDSTKLLVGLTATPKRHNREKKGIKGTLDDEDDVLSLKSVFKKVVYSYPIRKGIKQGYLAPLCGFRINTKTNLDAVKTTAGDFQVDQLSNAVNTPERNAQIVKAWKDNIKDKQTLCFTVDVQHAKDLAEAFLRNGVMAQPIYGDDPQRAEKLKWFESGKVQVLCNCALLTEGFDSPSVACIVLARPTKSGSLYTQMVGRGTRLKEGKESCTVIDVCDNYRRCSLVTLPSLLGLNPEMNLGGASVTAVAEKMETLVEKYPTVDLSHLTDINKVDAYIESLDLFSAPYCEEVKEYSKLAWMGCSDGSYLLQIPEKKELKGSFAQHKHEKLHITPTELEEFELSITSVGVDKKLGLYSSLKEAFASADEVVQRCRPDRMKLITREADWHVNPASDPAKKLLRSLSKNKPVLLCLCPGQQSAKMCPVCRLATGITAGQASVAINLLQSRRKK